MVNIPIGFIGLLMVKTKILYIYILVVLVILFDGIVFFLNGMIYDVSVF